LSATEGTLLSTYVARKTSSSCADHVRREKRFLEGVVVIFWKKKRRPKKMLLVPTSTVSVLRHLSSFAVDRLAEVDYNVANVVAEDVARVVRFAYAHDVPRLATAAMHVLKDLDEVGGVLISLVAWLVMHTP
jgi:hypothetical protein